ncbi:MAG TPA: dienelactone hydrolase family protein [Gaiellaceae bacterium]
MKRAVLAVAAAALLAGCGSSTPHRQAAKPRKTLLDFAYDRSAPLAYVDRGRVNTAAPLAIHDVSFASSGQRIEGFLVLPPGRARRPAVVFAPGTGGDRREMLAVAGWLAARNVVALTITPPSPVPSTAKTATARLDQIRTDTVAQVVAVRRAVDVLRTLPTVDPHRIGYVGWSAGARLGTLVAASEPRIRAFVLLSAGAAPISAYVAQASAPLKVPLRRVLESVDPPRYVARARPGSLLLENGRKDEVVPRAALLNVVRSAPKGTTVHWYNAPHALNRAAYHDAYDWLGRRLPITGPRVRGAETA